MKYVIEECGYDKYVEINGIEKSNCPQGDAIKNNKAKFFVIKEDDKYFGQFCMYDDNNWTTIRNYLKNDQLMNSIITYLKDKMGINYITVIIPEEETEIIEYVINNYKNIEISESKQEKWIYENIKIKL